MHLSKHKRTLYIQFIKQEKILLKQYTKRIKRLYRVRQCVGGGAKQLNGLLPMVEMRVEGTIY